MQSERLTYEPLSDDTIEAFHRLARDEYVRRYLMDGQLVPREWSQERVRESGELFERRGVGLWLAYDTASGALAGSCGFLVLPSTAPEPQLVYALFERFAGRGYATEMARAAMAEARRHPGFETIAATVDDVNAASVRVLKKLGFEQVGARPGTFGPVLVMRLTNA